MSKTHPLTVVHGAAGTQGAAIVRALLEAGHEVRAVTRTNPLPGTHPRLHSAHADLADATSLVAAYEDADAVVVQLPLAFTDAALDHAEHVLQALRKAGVGKAVFNTGAPQVPDMVGSPYLDARTALRQELPGAVAVSAVVSPPGPYVDNLGAPWSAPLVVDGRLLYPLPAEAPVPWVALADIATTVAELLDDPAPAPVTVVAGPQALTGPEVAAEIGAALGRAVEWESIGHEAYAAMLVPYLGEEAGNGVAAVYAPPPPDAPPPPAPDPGLVRVGATTVREWAAGHGWPTR